MDSSSRGWVQLPPAPTQYLEVRSPGIEVGEDPYLSPHTGWPDATKPVWGIDPEDTTPKPSSKLSNLLKSPGLSFGNVLRNDEASLLPQVEGPQNQEKQPKKRRRLSSSFAWWSLFMLACLVVFGGLGAVVGWTLAAKRRSNS